MTPHLMDNLPKFMWGYWDSQYYNERLEPYKDARVTVTHADQTVEELTPIRDFAIDFQRGWWSLTDSGLKRAPAGTTLTIQCASATLSKSTSKKDKRKRIKSVN